MGKFNIIQRNNIELILDWDMALMKTGFGRLNHNHKCHVNLLLNSLGSGKNN